MKARFRITRRGSRGGALYCVDTQTRKRTSLKTSDVRTARRIVLAKNEAEQQPALNRQLAKAYLAGTDAAVSTRTWQNALEALTNMKQGANKERWQRAAKDKAFAVLLPRVVVDICKTCCLGTVPRNSGSGVLGWGFKV